MTTKLRLFAIRTASGQLLKGEDGTPLYFSDKRVAKATRDRQATPSQQLYITLGPDHKRNQSIGGQR